MIINTSNWHWPQWLLIWGAIFDLFGSCILVYVKSNKKPWLLHWFLDTGWVFIIVIAGGFFQ